MDNLVEDIALRGKTGVFSCRSEAGRVLSRRLETIIEKDGILLAIPSGGVPVACAIAKETGLPLDVIVARKIQVPGNKEAGFGAIGPDGEVLLHERILSDLNLSAKEINVQLDLTRESLKEREKIFRGENAAPDLKGRQVILVDDGMATGYTMLAAVEFSKRHGARSIAVATPTAPQRTVNSILPHVDWLICLNIRGGAVFTVADAYAEWHDLRDEEAARMLFEAQHGQESPG